MASPKCLFFLAALGLATLCSAGPLGPLPNVTSSDLGLKEGSCALGDVVYMPGDEFPGSSPCERCTCTSGSVQCAKQRCEPRPGCKALHRPDHCCPIYQCECEQEGRVYGNGEKLVDPQDPCRVCYCQGGEVVCRRIACFVRDDCRPRLVPGRCCPEYDNCPLRGVTTVPGVAPSISSISSIENVESSPVPPVPKENIKQEITIKEITPVSEIPVITEVKIKEILPSPSIEVAEYSSSKSPLIVREATSEKAITDEVASKIEDPVVVEVQPSSSSISISSVPPEVPTKINENTETKNTNDSPPSKISLSTQDSINSEIYPSIITSIPTMGAPSITPEVIKVSITTKAPIMEEEDPSFFDHNPAFPPIPDDLSVLSNHEDEIVSEQTMDGEHVSLMHEITSVASASPSTEAVTIGEPLTTTSKEIIQTTPTPTTVKVTVNSEDLSTLADLVSTKIDSTISTETTSLKESPMLNLRSAIPTEILNIPSSLPEDITGELDEVQEVTTTIEESAPVLTSSATERIVETEQKVTEKPKLPIEIKTYPSSVPAVTDVVPTTTTTTQRGTDTTLYLSNSQAPQEQTTNSIPKSNIATEITAQTELSSLPIETSDQNPHDISENIAKEKTVTSTSDPIVVELSTSKIPSPIDSEVITVSRAIPSSIDNQSFENVETTEFILTSFASSESATDAVELIKISAEPEKSASIIESVERRKNNVLTDLINLVGDVASIGDHTVSPDNVGRHSTGPVSISDSEEFIPVNAGYKSKNKNWNVNTITEIPVKSKSQVQGTKQKVIEIEDDDNITDSPPPNDKVEPTTRRPIIDNVSDDNMPENKTEKKDIEIITKSFVPTINRRPTKVVMKKSNDRPTSDDRSMAIPIVSASSELATESAVDVSSELAITAGPDMTPSEAAVRREETTIAPSTAEH